MIQHILKIQNCECASKSIVTLQDFIFSSLRTHCESFNKNNELATQTLVALVTSSLLINENRGVLTSITLEIISNTTLHCLKHSLDDAINSSGDTEVKSIPCSKSSYVNG